MLVQEVITATCSGTHNSDAVCRKEGTAQRDSGRRQRLCRQRASDAGTKHWGFGRLVVSGRCDGRAGPPKLPTFFADCHLSCTSKLIGGLCSYTSAIVPALPHTNQFFLSARARAVRNVASTGCLLAESDRFFSRDAANGLLNCPRALGQRPCR
jgi:hypothetical protein